MSTPTAEALKAAAHGYARRRLRVIPLHFIRDGECSCRDGAACKSAGKHPILKGWQDRASTSGADIEEWWTRRPQAGVGIATGEQSGLFVLDVDPDNGGSGTLAALEDEHGPLPYTRTIRTGSGGKHYYFTWPGFAVTNSAGKLGDGLDIRGNGGQVVAPPSRSGKGDYVLDVDAPVADAPTWLLDLLRPRAPQTPAGGAPVSPAVASHYAAAALAAELAAVRASQEGGQNDQLNKSAFNLGQLVAVGALDRRHVYEQLVAASRDSGYPARDGERAMEDTIVSGLDAGELEPRTPWPPAGTGGPTEEEIAAIKAIYGENSPEMSWLFDHSDSARAINGTTLDHPATSNGTTPKPVPETGVNYSGTSSAQTCQHAQIDVDALLAEHPGLSVTPDWDIDRRDTTRDIRRLLDNYRRLAGETAATPHGACALIHHYANRADLDMRCEIAWDLWVGGTSSTKPSSWDPVDLTAILDGTAESEQPTLLARADGHCLLYPGLLHWMQGEPESGKSWVAQYTAAEVLKNGGSVVYIDHESTPHAVVGRLHKTLGVSRDDIQRGLRYIQPEAGVLKEINAFATLLSGPADLVVIDGVTDALGIHGSSMLDK